jgi:uncharacterized protein
MVVWALADLHLALGVPEKNMDFFGPPWVGYISKIQKHWLELIQPDDLILIPGDISWAKMPEDAKIDLDWIDKLPGTKVMIKGNHDYWWTSLSKLEKILPPSIHLIQNNSFQWKDISIGGSRLWDTNEYNFENYIEYVANPRAKPANQEELDPQEIEKIFTRELGRLEHSLKSLSKTAVKRIVMTHYPPIDAELHPSRASAILEKYKVDICVFGHLHNFKKDIPAFGNKNGIQYILTAGDYLDFCPVKLLD